MTTYNFATITAAQALALTASDVVQVDQGSANATTILFGPGVISMTVGGATVVFGPGLSAATTAYADGSRLFVGTDGADSPPAFGRENNGLYGGASADTLNAGGGTNQLQGNQGDDSLVGGSGYDVIYGGQDNDAILVGSSSGLGMNFAQGNKGDDTIGGAIVDSDTLLGGQGNDLIGATGLGPPTVIQGRTFYFFPVGLSGGGNDILNGNLGNDVIFSGTGSDQIFGEDGNDQIIDTGGRNLIDGGAGDDFIEAAGQTTIIAGAGNDVVLLDNGVFVISLGDGDDYGHTRFEGGTEERFTIDGGAGGDDILSGDGVDSLSGGEGDDTLDGSGGADILAGGPGSDEFDFYGGESFTVFADLDQIVDWTRDDTLFFQNLDSGRRVGASSILSYAEGTAPTYDAALAFANAQIAGRIVEYVAVQVGGDVFVFADSLNDNGDADTAVRLVGRTLADIDYGNFV